MSRRLNTRSLYEQVHDELSRDIAEGKLKPGTFLRNEGELAREYGVSTGTVRKALEQMEAEFLITRRQGRGTFVNDPSSGVHSQRLARVHEPNGARIWGEVKS